MEKEKWETLDNLAKEKMVEETFVKLVKQKFPNKTIVLKRLNSGTEVVIDGKNEGMFGFDNIIDQVNSGEPLIHVTQVRVDMLFNFSENDEYLKEWNKVKDKIQIYLKNKKYGVDIKAELITRSFINDINYHFVIDLPDKKYFINEKMLKDWNVSLETIERTAVENCRNNNYEYTFTKPINLDKSIKGIILLNGKDSNSCHSILVNPQKLRQLLNDNELEGKEVLAVIPFRDVLFIAENTPDGYFELSTTSRMMQDDRISPYPVSCNPFKINLDGIISPAEFRQASPTYFGQDENQ